MQPRKPAAGSRNGASKNPAASGAQGHPTDASRLHDVRNTLLKTRDVFGDADASDDPFADLFTAPAPPAAPTANPAGRRPLTAAPRPAAAPAPERKQARRRFPVAVSIIITAVLLGGSALFVWLRVGSDYVQMQQYTNMVLLGDSLTAAGDYAGARGSYAAALETQVNDGYLQQRLAQLDRLLSAEHLLAADPKDQHRRLVAQGDSLANLLRVLGEEEPLLTTQIQTAAREAYLRALVYNPQDQEIRAKLTALNQRTPGAATPAAPGADPDAERIRARQQQLNQYETAVREGDQFMAKGDYLEAQVRFKEALIYQPEDTYVAGRLEMIDRLWKEENRNERYSAYLRRGDEMTQSKLYEQARTAYTEALRDKPGDPVALARIEATKRQEQEAQRELTQQRERLRQYEQLRADGLTLLAGARYAEAVEHYVKALAAFPGDANLTEAYQNALTALQQNGRVDEQGAYKYLPVESQPKLIGGLQAFYATIRYPTSAVRANLEGRVFVHFIVDENGRVQDPRIVRSLSADCDQEVLRAIRNARFEPAQVDGKLVRAYHTLHVDFRLQEK